MTCSFQDCDKKHEARGLCATHYRRLTRHGSPDVLMKTRHTGSPTERFWKHVKKSDSCWLWTGQIHRNGYGLYTATHKTFGAHRYAYADLVGPIPNGYQLDHMCHNRGCVNPDHLRVVTNKQNNENPSGLRSDNTSGYQGVTFSKRNGRWYAHVQHEGKKRGAGGYATAQEAAEAARQLRLLLFTHNDADRRRK
jgi:hypothetical protein